MMNFDDIYDPLIWDQATLAEQLYTSIEMPQIDEISWNFKASFVEVDRCYTLRIIVLISSTHMILIFGWNDPHRKKLELNLMNSSNTFVSSTATIR